MTPVMSGRIFILVTTTPKTCTVRISADGTLCGEPAVRTFTSSMTGTTYAECEAHDAGPNHGHAAEIHPGSRVDVGYRGETRTGTVVSVTHTYARVEIPMASGDRKVITRRLDEIDAR